MIHVRKLALAALVGAMLVACGSSGAAADGPDNCSPARPCGSDRSSTPSWGYNVVHVQVDGRAIPCIVWDSDRAGGISCDWSAR